LIDNFYNVAVELVDKNLDKGFGEKIAIYYNEEEITYSQLAREVNKLGNGLKSLGIEIENRVALLLLDCPQFYYSFLGAIKIGAVAVPVNTLLKTNDYIYVLNDCRAKVLVISEELLHLVEPILDEAMFLKYVVVVGKPKPGQIAYDSLVGEQPDTITTAPTYEDDPSFWIYSSGTTGFPKGIVHLHHDMVSAADATAKGIFNMNSDDIVYSTSKLFFSYGLGNALYYPLRVGAAAVLSPVRPDPQVVFDLVKKYRPTVFCSVPTSYTAMLQAAGKGEADFSSVRVATSAGETLPEVIFHRWKERFGIELLDGLGCSEASNTFICNRPGEVVPGSTGKVVPGYEVRLVDEDGAIVPCGEIGTLQVKGDSLAAYYWNKHEKTKSSFLGHWFNTGDRFYQDEAGYLWYVGRTDDMLKVGGIWVSPIEVERTLLKHDCVLECGVVGKEDDNKLVKPKAFVVLKDGYEACEQLEQELKQFVKGQIAHYKYPRWIEFIPQLPKTATGKIQRYKLKEL